MHKLSSSFTKLEISKLFRSSRLALTRDEIDIRLSPTHEPPGKLLLVIPRKVGTAVERNLIKRRIKSIFRENRLYLLPYTFSIFARKKILDLSFEDLQDIILSVSSKLNS